ncbi:hypothetical protein B0H63DRAFT_11441 [Podospora didyma]|uniref:tRNA (uracil-O(2)-)-methyltransferase n=1 Tax=Podospora didyma TaxID=330526 RepID=A0AAE0JWM1_9PEZI|nr:hypothetical protein B0H63DRAFT_135351 [Podospora didyma]KAK3393144.1 hypothetical protein B0H63DRAFT_11441 [Podospora didyma]
MGFAPQVFADDAPSVIFQDHLQDAGGDLPNWHPLLHHSCSFDSAIFTDVMINLIKNPNINSSWLFRADIIHDSEAIPSRLGDMPAIPSFLGFERRRCIVRTLIPRNTLRDKPLDQTCLVYVTPVHHEHEQVGGTQRTLVLYLPHVSSSSEMPFYHPKVAGIAFLHERTEPEPESEPETEFLGSISISYLFFDDSNRSEAKLTRTAFHLLEAIHKHGEGRVNGYQKRVHHDVLLPQARVQNTYTALKQKYSRALIAGWSETTDPVKHVFEDLSIASFLIELWKDMYGKGPFPGFVDIGCGNGLLVHLLIQEGFRGWGFDARGRKSWATYNTKLQSPAGLEDSLRQLVLLPSLVSKEQLSKISSENFSEELIHDGRFPKGTFIISNHADELTPWTPIIAAISDCPFIMIPCCSHDLTGKRYRAPPPKDKTKSHSAYSSLVDWVAAIAKDCGWEVEQEMMRIPSTRNTGILGRRRTTETSSVDIPAIVARYGGTAGYLETVIKLANKPSSGGH